MKDIKIKKVELRLTADEKQRLKEYAEARSITMTEAIIRLCNEIFKREM